MFRVMTLVMMVLLTAFTGGGTAFSAKHSPHFAAAEIAHSSAVSSFGESRDVGQIISGEAPDMEAGSSLECCSDSTCFNPGHCHHAGVPALMTASVYDLGTGLSSSFDIALHRLPVQSIPRSISKPPRA